MRKIWEWWKRVAKRIGDIQARILLILFYFVVLGPFALALRWRLDPLSVKPGTTKGWLSKADGKGTAIERAIRQS